MPILPVRTTGQSHVVSSLEIRTASNAASCFPGFDYPLHHDKSLMRLHTQREIIIIEKIL